jgi:hypothetical protein
MPLLKPNESRSDVAQFLGEFVLAVPSGAVTTIAAGTTSAGHLLALQWTNATSKMLLRYLAARFVCTTGFTAGQEVGCEAFVARSYTGAHTGGTAITLSTNNQKRRVGGATSLVTDARVATAAALTNVTNTMDAQAFGSCSGFAVTTTTGVVIPKEALFDARDLLDVGSGQAVGSGLPLRSPIVIGANEGIIVRNTVLMGAAGVGRWQFYLEWDEVTP